MLAPDTPESVVARLRPHGRALFWPTLALILIALGAGYFFGSFPQGWGHLAILAVAGLLALLLWLVPLFRWLGRRYTITTRRIILRSGFLVRARQEVLLSRARDVTVRKNGLQAVFGSGDVQVGAGSDRPLVLRDVPRANLVQAALHDLMESTALVDDGGALADDGFWQAERG
jgi:membrane protein YdbS with pleckstrin-like domain